MRGAKIIAGFQDVTGSPAFFVSPQIRIGGIGTEPGSHGDRNIKE